MSFWITALQLAIANIFLFFSYAYVAYFIWWNSYGTSSDKTPSVIAILSSITTATQIIEVLNPGLTPEQERTIRLLQLQQYINSLTPSP